MMTYIISNFPEAYDNIVENIEEEMDDDNDPLTIKSICDKLLEKYDQTDVQSETKSST